MKPATAGPGLFLIPLLFAYYALLHSAQAQLPSPTPDGAYPNGNTAEGSGALQSLTTGSYNTAIGTGALFSNTTGSKNTANGYLALSNLTTGLQNTATGSTALYSNTTGYQNTATGFETLFSNTTGNYNTAIGAGALQFNTSGSYNTATGLDALLHNTAGKFNTANGWEALTSNTTGTYNTAIGLQALSSNTTGTYNTANGLQALYSNQTGTYNTAIGLQALYSNTTGYQNVANGEGALFNNTTGYNNTANGDSALKSNTTGSNNIALGANAGQYLTTGSNEIDIGNPGVAGEANTIRIGNPVATLYPDGTTHPAQTATFIAGIYGAGVTGNAVVVAGNGQLGVAPSSQRFKADIRPMDRASEAILALQPVSFRYKPELDPKGIPQFGLVAEEVEKVNPDLVARDAEGKAYTVRYDAVNAMLLNEFLKEHKTVQQLRSTVEKQQAIIAEQQKGMEVLTTQLKEQAAQIQKVATELQTGKTVPTVVLNN